MNESAISYTSDFDEGKLEHDPHSRSLREFQAEEVYRRVLHRLIQMEVRKREQELDWKLESDYRVSATEALKLARMWIEEMPDVEYVSSKPQAVNLPISLSDRGPASLQRDNKLTAKIRFLESQLQADRPYSQLYKLGAGSLFVAVISLVFWGLTGIGAPFHPVFAAAVVPASLGVIAMAFLIRRDKSKVKDSEKNIQRV